MKQNLLLLLILFPVVYACKETPTGTRADLLMTGEDTLSTLITYDVVIKNPDSNDVWMTECLKNFNREEFIDIIFNGIYNEKIPAFDIFEDFKISPATLKKMEEEGEVVRDEVGKFQFVEVWYFDKTSMIMTKHVTEIRLGTESYNSDGMMVGYEPLFKVMLN